LTSHVHPLRGVASLPIKILDANLALLLWRPRLEVEYFQKVTGKSVSVEVDDDDVLVRSGRTAGTWGTAGGGRG
jgi:hypothetical protein